MAHPVLMPKPGQMTEECTLILWRKAEGEPVHKGDVLFEIETDKSAMEVESWEEGVLLRQVVAEGATVPVNSVCAWVGEPGEAVPEGAATEPATEPGAGTTPQAAVADPTSRTVPADPAVPDAAPVAAGSGERIKVSPRARRRATESGIDLAAVTGTGPRGRITERDVLGTPSAPRAMPATASGPAAAAVSPVTAAPAAVSLVATPAAASAQAGAGEPMTRLRRVIAERLTHSWTTTPHFTVTVAVNVHRLLALRSDLKLAGTTLSVTDFVMHATTQTLVEFPDLNSHVDGASVVRHPRVHLGLAVSVPGGLLVPVIRDADLLSVTGIHERSRELIEGARAGTLGPDALSGSTFTVSNLGMFEVDEFSAIINPGEGGILAVASAVPTPVVAGDGIAIRPVMKLTLSADHRVVDGETGARFLGALRRRLEDPSGYRAGAAVGLD